VKILVIEDDLALADVLSFTLRRAGFDVRVAYDGVAGLEAWQQFAPNLVILDLNLPRLDGMGVCRALRAQSDVPIIMLTVRNLDTDIVQGLEAGADDYVVKPFSPTQLVARVRAVLRRTEGVLAPAEVLAGDLRLDRARYEVQRRGQEPIRLSSLETRLLETLMIHAGQVVTADTLLNAVWAAEGGDRAMLKQLVYRLRNKIEPDPAQPIYIETIPGVGYAFVDTGDDIGDDIGDERSR
jgi:DNA-binding response OmpR family regulator